MTKAPISNHKRGGSIDTIGDESEDEDNVEVGRQLLLFNNVSRFGFKPTEEEDSGLIELNVTDRNSSDSSMLSSDLDTNNLDIIASYNLKDDDKSGLVTNQDDWSSKDRLVLELQGKVRQIKRQLKLKDEELTKVNRIRQDVEAELEDLTASLFQEAHNMVREANEKQAAAEKVLKESQMKMDVLTAEVAALKTLVITSTPSSPNPHLHPQILKEDSGVFAKKHRRSPSHYNLKYGRENSPPDSPIKEPHHINVVVAQNAEGIEMDPVFHKEFLLWRDAPIMDKSTPFLQRIFREDIDLCLNFINKELLDKLSKAIEDGRVLVESVGEKGKSPFPKTCALMQVPRLCFYRMSVGEPDTWYSISQICRNRIIAVCDFLNYLQYIEKGLVKSSVHDVYWEIIRLRKNMSLARLGLDISSSSSC